MRGMFGRVDTLVDHWCVSGKSIVMPCGMMYPMNWVPTKRGDARQDCLAYQQDDITR